MDTQLKQVEVHLLTERSNYRQEYDAAFVSDLAADMSTNGFKVEYPITVYADGEQFIIIDGHTRHQGALQGSLYRITDHKPIMLVWIAVKDKPTDSQFKLQQLAANEQRRSPDEMSRAIGYKQALDSGASIEDLSKAIGQNAEYIQRRLNLLLVVPEVQDLVKHGHFPITFAAELVKLDTNFQRIALQEYRKAKKMVRDEFLALVNALYTKQSQCSLFDLALFNGKPIEEIIEIKKVDRPKSREELQKELEAEKAARAADREFARRKYAELQKRLAKLETQLGKVA